MKVYVETNFLLEVALEPDEAAACDELVQLAEHRKIELAVPAFCFVEAAASANRRRDEASRFAAQLKRPDSLNRLPWLDQFVSAFRIGVVDAAARSVENLTKLTSRLLDAAEILELNADTIRETAALPVSLGLAANDGAIFATVLAAMRRLGSESVFLNRNVNDFEADQVGDALTTVNSKLIGSFKGGRLREGASRRRPVIAAPLAHESRRGGVPRTLGSDHAPSAGERSEQTSKPAAAPYCAGARDPLPSSAQVAYEMGDAHVRPAMEQIEDVLGDLQVRVKP